MRDEHKAVEKRGRCEKCVDAGDGASGALNLVDNLPPGVGDALINRKYASVDATLAFDAGVERSNGCNAKKLVPRIVGNRLALLLQLRGKWRKEEGGRRKKEGS